MSPAEHPSSPWWLNHWEDGVKRRPSLSAELAVTWVRGPAHPQEKPPATSFNVLPSPCGEAMQTSGSTVCPPPLLTLNFCIFFLILHTLIIIFIMNFLHFTLYKFISFYLFISLVVFCAALAGTKRCKRK